MKNVKLYIKKYIIFSHYRISTLLFSFYFINILNQILYNYIANRYIIIIRK